MMKTKYLFMLIISLTVASCSDWLTVSPKTEKPTHELFSSQNGFRDALTGAYIEMTEDSAYGEDLTMGKIEFLINFWTPAKGSGDHSLSIHDYMDERARGTIDRFYGQLYKVILAVNSILEYVDQRKELLSPGVYETVKGEALALRAYCHLDVLRLFGPVPGDAGQNPILSYVTTVTKEIHAPVSYAAYKGLLVNDMEQAEALLKYSYDNQKLITDDYFRYRKIRMNYYGVKALQARAYLWFGERELAYECANEVIFATNDSGERLFRLGGAAEMAQKNYTLTHEHIFALYRFDMYKKYTALFKGEDLYKGTNETLVKRDLYGNTGSDIREQNLWEQITLPNRAQRYVMKKYEVYETVTGSQPDYNYIPLLRLSEMYFIAVETGPRDEAQKLWDEFLVSRNVNTSQLPADNSDFRDVLVAEYRKELYAEGQVFYLYKRLDLPHEKILWADPGLEVNYVLPLPATEIIN